MIIFAVFIVLLVSGPLICKFSNSDGTLNFFGFMLGMVGGIGMFIAPTTLYVNRMEVTAKLAGFEAMRSTMPANNWQDAAWRSKAAGANAEIARLKYYNTTVFDLWIPDEVADFKPLNPVNAVKGASK